MILEKLLQIQDLSEEVKKEIRKEIEEQKLSEKNKETIKDEKEKLLRLNQSIIENSRDGIIVYGSDLRYQVWNTAMKDITGLAAEQVLGKHPLELFPFLKDRGIIKNLEDVLNGKTIANNDFPYTISQTGKSGWASDSNSPLKNSSGEIVGVIANVRDITNQKLTEEKLLEREEQFRSITENTTDVIMRFDREHRHVYVNPAVSSVVPIPADKFIGKTHKELGFPTKLCNYWEQTLEKVIQTKKIHSEQFEYNGKILDWKLIPEFNSKGEVITVLSSSRDITDQASLITNMQNGFALHELICDQYGRPIDYRFLNINPAFEEMTGLKKENILKKTIKEVIPKIEQIWIDIYGDVALTGKPTYFEQYTKGLDKWFSVSAYSPKKMQFVTLFKDISDRKQNEEREKIRLELLTKPTSLAMEEYLASKNINFTRDKHELK